MTVEFAGAGVEFRRADSQERYRAVADVELEIAEGEFLCLLGPSGCGKTTLLHMLAGFVQPTEGEVRVSGRRIDRPGADRGVVFQSQEALFDWLTVEENVAYGLRVRGVGKAERRAAVRSMLELVHLADHRKKYPRELSGGMKQRVQIARVLVNDPQVLLMDEPFGALDAQTRTHMQEELQQIWVKNRKTVVFVTHDVGEAVALGDRIAVMTPGPAGTIKAVVQNRLPRPREMDEAFMALFKGIRRELDHGEDQHGGSPVGRWQA
jgi:NitT/TauT family transport system ATP-binding protein